MSVEVVRRVKNKYPTPLGARQGEFLIEVARALGAGLLRKSGGAVIRLPAPFDVEVAQDIVVFRVGGGAEHYDILIDAGVADEPAWQAKGPVDPARYLDVSVGAPAPAPPLPLPTPLPPPPSRPNQPYAVHTPLCREIGEILGVEGSPYVGNAAAIAECVGHLVWKVQFEGYGVEAARENARKRAKGEAAD